MAAIKNKQGNALEDSRVGHVFNHKVGKTLTERWFNAFTEFGMTTNPLSKSKRDGFRGRVAPPGRVMHIVFSQSGRDRDDCAPRGPHRNRTGHR